MMTTHQIKSFARRQLQGRWGSVIGSFFLMLVTLAAVLLGLLLLTVPALAWLISLLLEAEGVRYGVFLSIIGILIALVFFIFYCAAAALSLGQKKLLLRLVRGRNVRAGDVFRGFRDGKHFQNFFFLQLILLGIDLLISVPSVVCYFVYGRYAANTEIMMWLGNIVSMILSFLLAGAEIYCADNRSLSASESIQLGLRMIEKHKGQFFVLCLSFLPWYLLSMITFGIASIWTIPYYMAAKNIFFLSALGEEQTRQQEARAEQREDSGASENRGD